eukprot:358593-Chlamydomonas_euryale.AAC.6
MLDCRLIRHSGHVDKARSRAAFRIYKISGTPALQHTIVRTDTVLFDLGLHGRVRTGFICGLAVSPAAVGLNRPRHRS